MIHVDLVQYAKQVIDGCGDKVSPLFASFTTLKDTAETKISELQQFVPKQVDDVNQALAKRHQAFKTRIAFACSQARSQVGFVLVMSVFCKHRLNLSLLRLRLLSELIP